LADGHVNLKYVITVDKSMARIETGVDKLVSLVAEEKKVELHKAAKQLGVDPAVVQEWAEFLEEEGIVSLDFSLSKTFIVEKRMSKSEVNKKEHEYEGKKTAFVRRVDYALTQLESETEGFEQIKKQYDNMKSQIGDEIDAVKDEMEQLRHYEELKKSIDGDILKQKVEYQKTIDDVHARLSHEERGYKKIVEQIEDEAKKIEQEQLEFQDLKKEEHDLLKRIDAMQELIKRAHSRIASRHDDLQGHEERLSTLRELAEKLKQDIIEKRHKEIEPLLKVSDDQSKRILRIQDEIIDKVKTGRSRMSEFEKQSRDIADQFQRFFDRRSKTEEVVRELEKAKHEMKEQLNDLIRKAKAFEISKKGADTNAHIKQLESKFQEFDRRRGAFSKQLEYLKRVIGGKDDAKPSKSKPVEKTAPKKKPVQKKKK